MGQSASTPLALEKAQNSFHSNELQICLDFYTQISVESNEKKEFDVAKFSDCFPCYSRHLVEVLIKAIKSQCHQEPRNLTTEEAFVVFISQILRGDKISIFHLICSQFSCPTEFVLEFCNAARLHEIETEAQSAFPEEKPDQSINDGLVSYLLSPIENVSNLKSQSEFRKWIGSSILLQNILRMSFTKYFVEHIFNVSRNESPHVKKSTESLIDDEQEKTEDHLLPLDVNGPTNLITREAMWMINSELPTALRKEWRLLYNSDMHGKAFSRFLQLCTKQGPIVIISKETNAPNLFGGFASVNVDIKSEFFGDEKCFLFSIAPEMNLYQTTGYNKNYLYLSFGNKFIPNGFGMGGQMENYFGFFIDSTLDAGYCKARPTCSTYGSPWLSSKESFLVEQVEVWGLGEPPVPSTKKAKSILDDVDGKVMSNVAGRKEWSAGLREPLSDEEDEEDQLNQK